MFQVGVVAEGDGDQPALRVLLPRILGADGVLLTIGSVLNAHGGGNLTREGGIESFFDYVAPGHDAVLFVLEGEGECHVDLARGLARRLQALQPSVPVAVVAANRMFEAWFLADLESLVGQRVKRRVLIAEGESFPEPDDVRNPKARLVRLTAKGTTYKETTDQPALASMIDLAVVSARSRSFRRLESALRDLQAALQEGRSGVTPR